MRGQRKNMNMSSLFLEIIDACRYFQLHGQTCILFHKAFFHETSYRFSTIKTLKRELTLQEITKEHLLVQLEAEINKAMPIGPGILTFKTTYLLVWITLSTKIQVTKCKDRVEKM